MVERCQANTNQKKVGVTKKFSNNTDFIAKNITRDREGYCKGTEKLINQEDLHKSKHATAELQKHMQNSQQNYKEKQTNP